MWPFIYCLSRKFLSQHSTAQHSHVFHLIFCLSLLEGRGSYFSCALIILCWMLIKGPSSVFWSLLFFYWLSFHTCSFIPFFHFFLPSFLPYDLSVPTVLGPSWGDRQPQLSCQALPAVPGWGGCQVQHGDSGSILGVSQLQCCRWFSCVWLGTCSHFTLTATGFHPAPEGSVSRDLAQNSEITDISLNGNTVTIFHLDHLISSAWLAMKHSDSWGMKL